MTEPIDYAWPQARRGWTVRAALLLAALIIVVLLVLAGTWWGMITPARTVAIPPASSPVPTPIVLAQDPLPLTLRPNVLTPLPGRPFSSPGRVAGPYLILSGIGEGQPQVLVEDDYRAP